MADEHPIYPNPPAERRTIKPLGGKLYGHIPHLPGSRMGSGDHRCHDGQDHICTVKTRDRHDTIIVTEKLDGSNCGVSKIDGKIVPLTRAGYTTHDSPHRQHHMFGDWVYTNFERFDALLTEGDRCIGEWLALAHGTRYDLRHEPFVMFDIMRGTDRILYAELVSRCDSGRFTTPALLHVGGAVSIDAILAKIATSGHGALDPVEGAVWRVERVDPVKKAKSVDFLAKYVRPDKQDGAYFAEYTGADVWNWRP